MLSTKSSVARTAASRRTAVKVQAASWTKVATKTELGSSGKKVVEIGGAKILLAAVGGEVFAVSNKCSHLGLPLQGKTALFQAEIKDKCVVCPAHKTAFDLATGQVKGEWCPSFPSLPVVGKMSSATPLPTYQVRVDDAGNVEVLA